MRGWNTVITAATQAILNTYITIILHVYSQKKRDVCFRELSCSLVPMYLAWKYLVKALFLRPLLDFTLSSELLEGLPVCRAKALPSFFSYFKTLNTVNSLLDGNFWDRHYLAILRRCPSYAESTEISK